MYFFSRVLGLCFVLVFKTYGNVGDRAMAECRRYGQDMIECKRILFHSKQRVPADVLEFPHMVMLGFDPQRKGEIVYNCGGSLISSLWVLSAAHCLGDTRTGPPVKARLGTTTLEDEELEEDIVQERNLVELIRHPDYKPPVKYNDIALMRMDKPISDLGQFIKIACLKMVLGENITTARASGFGKTSYDNTDGSLTMMHVDLDIIPQTQCNNSLKTMMRRGGVLKNGVISSQICAGDLANGGKDTCQGDSGGPLQIYPKLPTGGPVENNSPGVIFGDAVWRAFLGREEEEVLRRKKNPDCKDSFFLYEILGVTSFGRFCGFKNSPGVYTRVSEFMDWIEDIVWPTAS